MAKMPERYPNGEVWASVVAKMLSRRFPVVRKIRTRNAGRVETTTIRYMGGVPARIEHRH